MTLTLDFLEPYRMNRKRLARRIARALARESEIMEDQDKEMEEVEVVEDDTDANLPSSDDYEAQALKAVDNAHAEESSVAVTQMYFAEALVYAQLATMAAIREATGLLLEDEDDSDDEDEE